MSISQTDLYAANIAVHYKNNALHCKEFYGKFIKTLYLIMSNRYYCSQTINRWAVGRGKGAKSNGAKGLGTK